MPWYQIGEVARQELVRQASDEIAYSTVAIAHFTEAGNEKEVKLYTDHLQKWERRRAEMASESL